MECDRSDEKGRFLLTGSQQYHLMKNIFESLAGRIAILELAAFSMRELTGCSFNQPFIPSETYIEERQKDYHGIADIWKKNHLKNWFCYFMMRIVGARSADK
ncbi:MAG: AAA family ATPase [Lachnospiraceae bacterium]|nr:AAA family ATPase [Lachnospiraceae bacterium]